MTRLWRARLDMRMDAVDRICRRLIYGERFASACAAESVDAKDAVSFGRANGRDPRIVAAIALGNVWRRATRDDRKHRKGMSASAGYCARQLKRDRGKWLFGGAKTDENKFSAKAKSPR